MTDTLKIEGFVSSVKIFPVKLLFHLLKSL